LEIDLEIDLEVDLELYFLEDRVDSSADDSDACDPDDDMFYIYIVDFFIA
jgi:hypothetical protein